MPLNRLLRFKLRPETSGSHRSDGGTAALRLISQEVKLMEERQFQQFSPNADGNGFLNGNAQAQNALWQYVQSLAPETVEQLSQPQSQEAVNVMERNIAGLLGGLPSEQFEVSVTTTRENLGRLLASAMMSGYFLRNAEQRMAFERSLQTAADEAQ
jgi:hypothetical protein